MIEVRFDRGVHLPRENLWLDPWSCRELAFVSHAHADHTGRHREIICSEITARLMQERLGAGLKIEHAKPFGQSFQIRNFEACLLPAGHVFGSAQLFVATEQGTLLYTGDFKVRPGLSAEKIEWLPAETLIMETTYGLSRFVFPPTQDVLKDIICFCAETIEDGMVPVLLGYSLGKAQELLSSLTEAGLPAMLHVSIAKITSVYEELGMKLPAWQVFDPHEIRGRVIIFPPSAVRSRALAAIKNRRVAAITGWAVEPGVTYRLGVDAAFPLSDHAGYDDLLRYVELVRPDRVLALHGYAREFARDLRARGIEAWSLVGDDQLEFSFNIPSPESAEVALEKHEESVGEHCRSQFEQFAHLGERLAKTSGRLAKRRLLANYFCTLEEEDLRRAALFLSGLPFPRVAARPLQMGWAVIKRALLRASNAGEARLRELSRRYRDAAATAQGMLRGRTKPQFISFADVERLFQRIETHRGPLEKADLLADFFAKSTAVEAKYVVKILTGDLRIGLGEGFVEEALAQAFGQEEEAVREAAMLTGDIGRTAVLARRGHLTEAAMCPFNPIKVMLASPEPNALAVWQRFHPKRDKEAKTADDNSELLLVEDKFDGIRAQIHKAHGRSEIYSRDLKCVTSQFSEIARAALHIGADVVLDAEIVAYAPDSSRQLGFHNLQRRLGRRSEDLFVGEEIPVVAVVFDLLWINGEPLLKLPLAERRRRLDTIALPGGFRRVQVTPVSSVQEIEVEFKASRSRGNEGLMIKAPDSIYSPGRRGLAWIKLKRELATLDVVVVGVEEGHGKRRGLLSDMTFAVRDEDSGELLEIGKAYSGLTDAELSELTEHFEERTLERKGSWRRVEPDIVLEVAFDDIRPSTRYRSGLALRFPRIKALRRDKTPTEIDTLTVARGLCAEKNNG